MQDTTCITIVTVSTNIGSYKPVYNFQNVTHSNNMATAYTLCKYTYVHVWLCTCILIYSGTWHMYNV